MLGARNGEHFSWSTSAPLLLQFRPWAVRLLYGLGFTRDKRESLERISAGCRCNRSTDTMGPVENPDFCRALVVHVDVVGRFMASIAGTQPRPHPYCGHSCCLSLQDLAVFSPQTIHALIGTLLCECSTLHGRLPVCFHWIATVL